MIGVSDIIAAGGVMTVFSLLIYDVVTAPTQSTLFNQHLPTGIATAMENGETAEQEAIVKANVVVFRSVDVGESGLIDVNAAHKFDKSTDQRPSSGWCYVELASKDLDGVTRSVPLQIYDGEKVTTNPKALLGLTSLGFGLADLQRLASMCPWIGI